MGGPPNQYRRRRLRRRIAVGLGALMVVVTAGAYAYWQDVRFPARSMRLAGLPVQLRVQNGVRPDEIAAIRRGLRVTDRFMARALGGTVHDHVEARVAKANGCRPFQSPGEAIVGEADRGFLCVDTASPAWQWLMLKDRPAAVAAAGHEYVHVLQGELGCLHSPLGERYRWITEGMAEEASWQAQVAAHLVTRAGVVRRIREDGALDSNLEPLQKYEVDSGRDPEYALWHLAVIRLLGRAAATGAAPAARPEMALRRFCDRVAARQPWHEAFARSFGVPVQRFYDAFERWRSAARTAQTRAASTGAARDSM